MCQFKTALASAPAGSGTCRCQAGATAAGTASAVEGVEPLRQLPPELMMMERYFAQQRSSANYQPSSMHAASVAREQEASTQSSEEDCREADKNNNTKVGITSRLKTAKSLPSQRRRVQFADDLGQSLIEVRLFESEPLLFVAEAEPQFLDLLLHCQFEQPNSELALRALMNDACSVKLSGLHLDPVGSGRVSLTGYAIVKNLSFKKRVFVRITADSWRSFADLEADYAGSMDEMRDAFEFELRCEIEEVDFEFCVCFEAEGRGQLWDSNDGANYKASLVKPRKATFSLWGDEGDEY